MGEGQIVLSVCMITYNHAAYIPQAVEGILMQQSMHPFELVIGDDCSDDGTTKICSGYAEKYPEIIKFLPSEKNNGMASNFVRTVQACSGKYIAFCEGDDYWTDPFKIQKQVDFLEMNPEYGMVHTGFRWFFSDTGKEKISNRNIPSGDVYDDVLIRSFIGNLTTVTRKELIIKYLNTYIAFIDSWAFYDRPIWLYVSGMSKLGYLPDITAIYRRHGEAMTSYGSVESELKFFISSYQIRFFFMDNYRKPLEKTRLKVLEDYNRGLLEYNSKIFDKKSSKEAFLCLKKSKNSVLKDYFLLLRSKGPFYGKVSSLLMFLFFEKKAFIKGLVNDLSF